MGIERLTGRQRRSPVCRPKAKTALLKCCSRNPPSTTTIGSDGASERCSDLDTMPAALPWPPALSPAGSTQATAQPRFCRMYSRTPVMQASAAQQRHCAACTGSTHPEQSL
jgi:hypothetical protein